MLNASFTFDPPTQRNIFGMTLCRDSDWKQQKMRVLIVLQSVDGRDLKVRTMLGSRDTRTPLVNALKYARQSAAPYMNGDVPYAAYAIVNFQNEKHLHLNEARQREVEVTFADRVHQMINKVNPTHIIVSGDEAMRALYPAIQHPQYKRGHVHEVVVNDAKVKVVNTLDFYRLLEKDGEYANLLGFWCRHVANLFIGKMPHDLSKVTARPYYVDTLEKFDNVMTLFDQAKQVAVDTETRNLSVLYNRLYTIQFAFDSKPNTGFVLSVDHPLAHWTDEERLYIKRELKKRFEAFEGPTLIMFNGMFDLRVIRQALRIPIIWLKVWEITFGEHLLDENVNALNAVTRMWDTAADDRSRFGGLRPILMSYGNDFYFRAKFSKNERVNIGSTDPRNEGFLDYACMDVVSLLHMRLAQIDRSRYLKIAGKSYQPYYLRHMMYQMSDTAHQLSHLRNDGSKISKEYLRYLLQSDGPLVKELDRSEGEFRVFKEVRQVNAELLKESGFKAQGLFTKAPPWMFRLGKASHKAKLFFDTLGLEPLSKTATGAPQINKAFIAHYRDKNKIIGLYGEYQALFKLWSTYAKGWYKKFSLNLDVAKDHHLRPDYTVWGVVTGRLASFGPNLQQIPSRGKLAKIIKRMFVADKGYMLIRFDYSAHEVRVWSIASGDKVLADSFKIGQKLRQDFIQNPTPENRKAIKEKGDLHILNVLRFFGKLVDKDHPLRDAVKAVVFGVLYGKSAETLGVDTKKGDMDALKGKISALYDESLKQDTPKERIAEINQMLEELDGKLTALIAEDRTKYAQSIIDKMFAEFKMGAAWTHKMQELAEKEFYVYSPIGRRRFLPAAMTGTRQIIAQQVRRGSNAPIQGFASEIGIKASRLIMEEYYRHLPRFKQFLKLEDSNWSLRAKYNRVVHDANYFAVPYEMVLPFIHISQYMATYGVTKAYKDQFNLDFTVEPEIELELGAQDANSHKWDWSLPNLMEALKNTLKESEELDLLDGTKEEILDAIVYPWKNKKFRAYLQENFPLLNVKDLDQQIDDALEKATWTT